MATQGQLRFFVDETNLGLGAAMAAARRDVAHPGHERLPTVPRGTLDPDWIPIVAALDLVVITRDKRIRRHQPEARLLTSYGVRALFLTGAKNLNTWDTLGLIVRQWDNLERFMGDHPAGPWAATLGNTGVALI